VADLTIVCPSMGRAGRVTSFGVFGEDLLLCVPESEAEAYRQAHPEALVDPHPDDVVGIAAKRQWMYDKYGSIFMLDDDATFMIDVRDIPRRLDPEDARAVVMRLADLTEQMNLFMFGTAIDPNPLYFRPQAPLQLVGECWGGSMGLLEGSKVWFPAQMKLQSDLWASALNAYHHRAIVKDMRYALPYGGRTPGGISGQRTTQGVADTNVRLVEAFGDAVHPKKGRKAADGKAHVLTVPW
jgi:hypothetical protein